MAVALGSASGIFDLGSGSVISAGDLARLALAAAGEDRRPVRAERNSPGDDTVRLDIESLSTSFNWRPKVGIAEGIDRLVRRYP
jgi:nucleoside-diphosphate-sugar epimerase